MTNSADPDQLASDLDLHCLLRQCMLCLAREGLLFNLHVSDFYSEICLPTYNRQKWTCTEAVNNIFLKSPDITPPKKITHHSLSVGGGGMLTARVPFSFCSSTVSINLVLDTSVIAFLMYLFSVALWKYLEAVILLMYFIHVFPFPPLCDELEKDSKRLIIPY